MYIRWFYNCTTTLLTTSLLISKVSMTILSHVFLSSCVSVPLFSQNWKWILLNQRVCAFRSLKATPNWLPKRLYRFTILMGNESAWGNLWEQLLGTSKIIRLWTVVSPVFLTVFKYFWVLQWLPRNQYSCETPGTQDGFAAFFGLS